MICSDHAMTRRRFAAGLAHGALLVLALAAIAGALAGCATSAREPKVQVVEKAVPTPVPCVTAATGPAPAYPDADDALKSAPTPSQRYGLVAAGRVLRIQRLAELEPVIAACRAPPAP